MNFNYSNITQQIRISALLLAGIVAMLCGLLIPSVYVHARQEILQSLKPIELNFAENELARIDGCDKATITTAPIDGPYGVATTMYYVDVPGNYPNEVNYYRVIANGTDSGTYFCDPAALSKFLTHDGKVKQEYQPASDAAQYVIMAINYILLAVAKLGGMLLWLASLIMMPLLTWSHFITDPLVQSGWPFLQGIANLGFIFALLFIAISTTLRLDIGNPKKMLPRLLIAALLINFSLVIAGVILDMSRVVMSIIFRAITGEATENLPYEMLAKSDLVNVAFNTGTLKADGTVSLAASSVKWGSVADVAMGTLFIWLGAIAFLIIAIGLLVRYIALILLLIVSPVAYLALAFPGMQGVAKKWWSVFLKYVLYGPIMIFVLALLVAISNLNIASDNFGGDGYSFVRAAFKVALMLGFSIAAAVAGSKLGAIGANATVNFAKAQGGRVLGGAVWAGKKSITAPTGYAYNRSGVKDFMDERKKANVRKESERSKKSWGRKAGDWAYGNVGLSDQQKTERGWASDVKRADKANGKDARDPSLAPERLLSRDVQKEVSKQQARAMVDRAVYDTDNDDQMEIIVRSADVVSTMDTETKNVLTTELKNRLLDPTRSADQKDNDKRMLADFNRSIRESMSRSYSKENK